MKILFRLCIVLALCTAGLEGSADSKGVEETLNVVWESFWQQQGYPQHMSKWRGPIRLKFSGVSVARHREFALAQLRRVADIAGIEVLEADGGTSKANLEIEFVRDNPVSRQEPCLTIRKPPWGIIQNAKITVGERAVRRCLLHEAMHAMGFSGHPSGNSILSYFGNSDELTQTDEFLLKALYTDEIKPGMYPFPALKIFSRRPIETIPEGQARQDAEKIAARFLVETVREMESFALAKGEPPRIVLRSSRQTAAGLERGRTEVLFLLGMAYSFGHIVEVDKQKGAELLARAASLSHGEAQVRLGDAYFRGAGVEQDSVEAYKWYLLAARKGSSRAKAEVKKLEQQLQQSQISEGQAKAAAWKPSNKEATSAPPES